MSEKKIKNFDKIKVFFKDVKVKYINYLIIDRELRGEANHRKEIISIDTELSIQQTISTLIHEMLHFGSQIINSDLNTEKNINGFTAILTTLIKDNKELFKTIINEI
jgi:hypothetical protein